jgi:hypothetical protein
MAQAHTTKVQNSKLEHLIKLGETFCIKAEDGEWEVEPGTYQSIKRAVEHTKAEICKQSRQRRKTMNIGTNVEYERRAYIAKENTRGRKTERG